MVAEMGAILHATNRRRHQGASGMPVAPEARDRKAVPASNSLKQWICVLR